MLGRNVGRRSAVRAGPERGPATATRRGRVSSAGDGLSLRLVWIGHAVGSRLLQRLCTSSERLRELRRRCPTRAEDPADRLPALAGDRVDDDDHRDEALVAEDAPVLERLLHRCRRPRARRRRRSRPAPRRRSWPDRRPGRPPRRRRRGRRSRRGTPDATASSACARRWRHSPWIGITLDGRVMLRT